MKSLKYSEILRLNAELGEALHAPPFAVDIFSNVIVAQIKEVLECAMRAEGVNARVFVRDYDNIVQESYKHKSARCAVIFWELSNIIDGFQFKASLLSREDRDALVEKVSSELEIVFDQLSSVPLVVFNKFSSLVFSRTNLKPSCFDEVCIRLNSFLETRQRKNVLLVDIDKIIAGTGIKAAADLRYFYSSKALYTVEFYKDYCSLIAPVLLSLAGRSKKVLLFDCDNTLWRGIVGEDGMNGIAMSSGTREGVCFQEVQSIAADLSRNGVLVGICSKNNPEDVDEIFRSHPDIVLKDSDLVIKKVNWSDKVENILAIAHELNLGLESIVLVDDSEFEVNSVRERLPNVTVVQVPKKISDYPGLIREVANSFFNINKSVEDTARTQMYLRENQRNKSREKFASLEEYIKSLGLIVRTKIDDISLAPRLAQLSQKTNQFNLTTRRYSESEMAGFIKSADYVVFSFEVSDKFGDYGTTGLCVVKVMPPGSEIDTFLMSCRVIGRNVEKVFFDYIMRALVERGIDTVRAQYIKTLKNQQVEGFYDSMYFHRVHAYEKACDYLIKTEDYKYNNIHYIEVRDGRQD